MTYKERIANLWYVEDVYEDPDGVFVHLVTEAHFFMKDGMSKDFLIKNPEEINKSASHVSSFENWREALYAVRHEVEIIE